MSEEFERDPLEGKPFDPLKVSPSRVNKLDECGVAFKLQYVDGMPPPRMGSFALFGSVVHSALEKWALNRSQDLVTLMRQAWLEETVEGPVVRDFLGEYQAISSAVLHAEKEAIEEFENRPANKREGKKCQSPRMTKHFKESAAAKGLWALQRDWQKRLNDESPWAFSEKDPLPRFYDDSLIIGKRYARRYEHLPPAVHTEFGFDIRWGDHQLVGYVDEIEVVLTPDGEIKGLGVIDYKTYRREPPELKDYRQLVMYDIAVRQLVGEGLLQLPFSLDDIPLLVGIDYVRQADVETDWKVLLPEGAEEGATSGGNSRAWWQMSEADHEVLRGDLADYTAVVADGRFRPAAKSVNPEFCDYGELCCLRNARTRGGCASRVEVVQ